VPRSLAAFLSMVALADATTVHSFAAPGALLSMLHVRAVHRRATFRGRSLSFDAVLPLYSRVGLNRLEL